MRLKTRAPSEIGEAEIAKIETIIADAGEVNRKRLHENLPRAIRIVTAHSWGRIAGVSTVKHPTPDYVAKIAERACFPELREITEEYGYTVVKPDFRGRGLATKLVRERLRLQQRAAFATVRSDNIPMIKILSLCNFQRMGREWQGRHGPVQLWIFRGPYEGLIVTV